MKHVTFIVSFLASGLTHRRLLFRALFATPFNIIRVSRIASTRRPNAELLGFRDSSTAASESPCSHYARSVRVAGLTTAVCVFLPLATTRVSAQSLSLNATSTSISEAGGLTAATVSVTASQPVASDTVVTLANPDPTEIIIPSAITIAANQTTSTLTVAAVNDGDIDGMQTVVVTASAAGFSAGTVNLEVTDDDTIGNRTLGGYLAGTIASGEYRVISDISVGAGSDRTLSIEPATALRFDPNVGLTVYGTLLAVGETGSGICFTTSNANPAPGLWKGIAVSNKSNPSTTLNHVEIAYAVTGLAVTGDQPALAVTNSEVHHCLKDGISMHVGTGEAIYRPQVWVKGCLIHDNLNSGIVISAFSYPSSSSSTKSSRNEAMVQSCEIFRNTNFGIYLSCEYRRSYGVGYAKNPLVYPAVTGNYIHDEIRPLVARAEDQMGSVGSAGVGGNYQNNLVVNASYHGMYFYRVGDGYLYPVIVNNTIAGAGSSGISTDALTSTARIRNNLVAQNTNGIEFDESYVPASGQIGYNNVCANSGLNWKGYPIDFGNMTRVNSNQTPADMESNISADPQFLRVDSYRLTPNSPCVNAGSNDIPTPGDPDIDKEPRISLGTVDIGSDEVQFSADGDADGDGLSNSWELSNGLNPLLTTGKNGATGDPDGDGRDNLNEYFAGTNPQNASSALRITGITRQGDDIRLTWQTAGGRRNQVQACDGGLGGFTDIGPEIVVPGSGDVVTGYVDSNGALSTSSRYYRVKVTP